MPTEEADADTPEETGDQPARLETDVELVPVEDVHPYVSNAKEHPEAQVDAIASSIRHYGWDQPLVVDADGELIKGHGRLQAAKKLGLTHVPVIKREDLSDADARAARIADNKAAESDWDDEMLAVELDVLAYEGYDADMLGFTDEDEYDDLLAYMEPPEIEEMPGVDEEEPVHKVVVIAETESDASFIGEFADEHDFEWHVVEG